MTNLLLSSPFPQLLQALAVPSDKPRTDDDAATDTARSLSALLASRSAAAAPKAAASASRAPPPLSALDAPDVANPLAAARYAADIFAYYRRVEPDCRPDPAYMARQSDVNDRMRAILIDWLVEVHLKFKLLPETLHLTASLVDRYLEAAPVSRKNLQLVGVTAMLVASKYEEIWAPEVRDFVYISDRAYTRDQILAMEKALLNSLRFRLTVPTAHAFAGRFLKAAAAGDDCVSRRGGRGGDDDDAKTLALYTSYLVELSLPDYGMLAHAPSHVAAGAVLAARAALGREPAYPEMLEREARVSRPDAEAAAGALASLARRAPTASLHAVYKKYCGSKHGEVAKLPPPPLEE